jgi:hypothetical protein
MNIDIRFSLDAEVWLKFIIKDISVMFCCTLIGVIMGKVHNISCA